MILSSMPDISIAYKLHLECGKMINLYDWLQSFLSIVDPQEVEDEDKVKVRPELQYPYYEYHCFFFDLVNFVKFLNYKQSAIYTGSCRIGIYRVHQKFQEKNRSCGKTDMGGLIVVIFIHIKLQYIKCW